MNDVLSNVQRRWTSSTPVTGTSRNRTGQLKNSHPWQRLIGRHWSFNIELSKNNNLITKAWRKTISTLRILPEAEVGEWRQKVQKQLTLSVLSRTAV